MIHLDRMRLLTKSSSENSTTLCKLKGVPKSEEYQERLQTVDVNTGKNSPCDDCCTTRNCNSITSKLL